MTFGKRRHRLLIHIANVYHKFQDVYGLHQSQAYLNSQLIARAIDNALIDMGRMEKMHLPEGTRPDAHKYAGFLSRWIAKERPIQIPANLPVSQSNDRLYWANASFAVFVMASFLAKDGIPANLAYHLKYWFAFRDERGETLSLVAYCCEQIS